MYCSNCGTKNVGNTFCTNCGNRLDGVSNNVMLKQEEKNGLKTASIVLGVIAIIVSITIVLSPVSIILSIIGLVLGIVATKTGKNVLGIVLNSVGLFVSIVILFLMGLFIKWAISLPDDYEDSYYEETYDYGHFGNDRYNEYY